MKNALIACAAIAGFLSIPVTYCTLKGYTSWYWLDSYAQVFVNGQRVP